MNPLLRQVFLTKGGSNSSGSADIMLPVEKQNFTGKEAYYDWNYGVNQP